MQSSIEDIIEEYAADELLVVGVGNPLRGDDAAGLKLAEAVARAGGFELLQCEDVPEKYTREMRTTAAETVLLVDAADMGLEAGQIRLVKRGDFGDVSLSTHNSSLNLIAKMLGELGGKEVMLLGIQPLAVGFGRKLSEVIGDSISNFARASDTHQSD